MTLLRWNEKLGDRGSYVLYSNDKEKAEEAGLTLSKRVRGPNGELVWYTADASKSRKPDSNPYAVLQFFDHGDEEVKTKLAPFKRDYDASWAKTSNFEVPVPKGQVLDPYQRAGVEYVIKHNQALIADEMGLGKTMESIGVANVTGARRILVLCPAAIRRQWCQRIKEWSVIPRVSTYPIFKSSDGVSPTANYVITSYDLLRSEPIHAALREFEWDLIIADEAHMLKTVDAQRTRALFGGGRGAFEKAGVAERAKMIVPMTGTPLVNRPRECYTLVRGICHEAIDWMSQERFEHRFNPSGITSSGHRLEKTGRLSELNARLRCNVMVRRLQRDVHMDLPDHRYELRYVDSNMKIREVLAKERLIDFDPKSLMNPEFRIDGQVATVRREMGEAMVPRVVEHVEFLKDVQEVGKMLLFAHHRSVIDALSSDLAKYGVAIHRGGMSESSREKAKLDFRQDPDCSIFIIQLDTAAGIDGLQEVAGYNVFAEPSWTPGGNEQCVMRTFRRGQHRNVISQFLLAEGSFNERVLSVVLDKNKDIHATTDRRLWV